MTGYNQSNLLLKGSMSIASYTFEEFMMKNFSKGQFVEMHSRSYSKVVNGEANNDKKDFARALSNLNLEWGSNVWNMMEIFDFRY
jgi:hypothetical protein